MDAGRVPASGRTGRRLAGRWRAPPLLAGAALALGALALTPAPAPAGAVAAGGLEVDAGWDGFFSPGAAAPVRVRVRADRLVRGELRVSAPGPGGDPLATVSLPVEVPGGSVKEYLVAVPTAAGGGDAEAGARLVDGDRVVAEGEALLRAAVDQELVGLLPDALSGGPAPAPAPLAVDAGTARFVALAEAELSAPAALDGLDVVGATARDLAALAPGSLAALLAWVDGGGHLLVDDADGAAVPGLPDEWRLGADGRAAAGLGEVRSAGGAMVAGRWASLVEPTPVDRAGVTSGLFGGFTLDDALARDAGLTVPRLTWLVGFLVAYVGVAVPVTLTVLRRRGRGELGWVVLPLVAVACAPRWASWRRWARPS